VVLTHMAVLLIARLIERRRGREIPLHRHGLEATERWSGEARGIGGGVGP
jgi:hypothetical protein